jgi:outer membrane protein OmpA-like peptidoglycan-associated protein
MPHPITRFARLMPMLAVSLTIAGCVDPAMTSQKTAIAPPGGRTEHLVYFEIDSSTLDARANEVIATIAAVAAKDEKVSVKVIGKTDRVGGALVNEAISKRRTEAVKSALVASGVPENRIDWGWLGERKPEVATADGKVEPRNRVVEITVAREP